MSSNPLRAEFILVGATALASLAIFLTSLPGFDFSIFELYGEYSEKWSTTLTLVFLVGLSYVVGIAITQITFFYPTRKIVANVRERHLADLRSIFEGTCHQCTRSGDDADLCKILTRVFDSGIDRQRISRELRFALGVGRESASPQAMAEYDYRRSNRQIFVGILPSYILLGISTLVLCAVKVDPFPLGIIVSMPVAAILILSHRFFYRSAEYQEEIAQAILLDAAFLQLFKHS